MSRLKFGATERIIISKLRRFLCCDLPVADAKGLPKSGELLVEVKVQADFVLDFDALLDDYLL